MVYTVYIYSKRPDLTEKYFEAVLRHPSVGLIGERDHGLYDINIHTTPVTIDIVHTTSHIILTKGKPTSINKNSRVVFVYSDPLELESEFLAFDHMLDRTFIVKIRDDVNGDSRSKHYFVDNFNDPSCCSYLLRELVGRELRDYPDFEPSEKQVFIAETVASKIDDVFYKVRAEKLRAAYDEHNPRVSKAPSTNVSKSVEEQLMDLIKDVLSKR